MSVISLRLPESLHKQLREVAKKEGVSINQIAASALSEKLAAWATSDYLKERAARGSREKFEAVLAKVPSEPPDPRDTAV
jgi:predicted transcriptional regulator